MFPHFDHLNCPGCSAPMHFDHQVQIRWVLFRLWRCPCSEEYLEQIAVQDGKPLPPLPAESLKQHAA